MHYITPHCGLYGSLVAHHQDRRVEWSTPMSGDRSVRIARFFQLGRLCATWPLHILRLWLTMIALLTLPVGTRAADVPVVPAIDAESAVAPAPWGVHGQATFINQWHPAFNAPYSGPNSLDPVARYNETADVTFMLGRRLWKGAEAWVYAEYDQGFGFNNTIGLAGFSNGEAYKVGANTPYLRLPRAFVRQVFALDGDSEPVEAAAGQLAGSRPTNNITLTAGKFSVVDIFDNNSYAHDPRADFMNWSVIDAGAFDYAADSWGFTNGAAVEWNQGDWTLRGGAFQLSESPNAKVAGLHFRQHSFIAEAERRYQWGTHPGKIKLLAFVNRGDMGSYADAIALAYTSGATPSTALVRRFGSNAGFALNFEQEVSSDLGVFARASANQGKKETFEFSDINRSVSGGISLQGNHWGWPNDRFALAGVINDLSANARRYFAAGGTGVLIGDGRLNYAPEKLVETDYSLEATKGVRLTVGYQRILHPAYNQDRGPVPVYSVRAHAEF